MTRFFLPFVFLIGLFQFGISQNSWQDLKEISPIPEKEDRVLPDQYRALSLDHNVMQQQLTAAPMEFNPQKQALTLSLPMPDGSFQQFRVVESPIMEAELAAKFPEIKNYSGKGIDDPTATMRMSLSPKGFNATILSAQGPVLIEPLHRATQTEHIAYRAGELARPEEMGICGMHELPDFDLPERRAIPQGIGNELLTYRIAVSAEDGYTNFHGGTVASAINAINISMDQINAVYERDASIRMILVGNNDQLIFLPGASDPFFTDPNQAGQNLPANQNFIDNTIGAGSYDIGHVFIRISNQGGTFVAGIATPGVVCRNGLKARGASSLPSPTGFNFNIEVVAHEIGHQFSSLHNFNTTAPACIGQRSASAAYEPGSGSTIMCYPGTCPPDNLQGNADAYFHGFAVESIINYSRSGLGANCPTATANGNSIPEVSVPDGGFFIPIETPFELTGTSSDLDGDTLLHTWEQMDLGPAGTLNSPVGNAPIFRTWSPTESPSRTFPRLTNLLNNTTPIGELLPDYARDLTFRLTVRDNKGGVRAAEMAFETTTNSGPFLVTHPNTAETFTAGFIEEVTWDVANTTLAPVNCAEVDVRLSVDGGITYPYLLADNVPNNGSTLITWPDTTTIGGRLRVEASDNIFFDVSNRDFILESPANAGFLLYPLQDTVVLCGIASVELPLLTSSLLGFSGEFGLSAVGNPAGVDLSFVDDTLSPGEQTVIQISTSDTLDPGSYQLTILGLSATGQSDIETVQLLITDPILPGIAQPLTPGSGGTGVGTNPSFSWAPDPESERYTFELATSPGFGGTTLVSVSGITGTSYTPSLPLGQQATYYWRVRGENICGKGPFMPTQGFQTGFCLSYTSSDVPKTLPIFGNPAEITSSLATTMATPMTSVRVVGLSGTHTEVSQLTMKLRHATGEEITLFSDICGDGDADYDLNFVDGAESVIDCPPVAGGTYAPEEALAAFNGLPGVGTWVLTVQDFVNFDNGELQAWGLELCSEGPAKPTLITNIPLNTDQWALDTVGNDLLRAQDATTPDNQLIFTVVNLPAHGGLLLNGTNLVAGDAFSQEDINQNRLTYLNNGDDVAVDSFRFDVTNIIGGWIGVYGFDINLTKGTTSILDPLAGLDIDLYPNPAQSEFTISLEGVVKGAVQMNLFNLQGQLVHQLGGEVQGNQWQQMVSTESLAPGVYVVELQTELGSWRKRLVLQR
ncbi:MAG: reprolysin-like metallopeptidase [Bacteroidota bacterium]